ncbi:MAG: GGDEF and EAL domain-containing protein [Comamonas sp.]
MPTAAADPLPSGPAPGVPLAQWHALDQVVALAEFDANGRMLRANAIYLLMLGLSPDDVPGRLHRSLCLPAWADSAPYEAFWAQLQAGQAQSGVIEHQRPDGQPCWLESMYTPVFDAQGRVERVVQIAVDTTERRRSELAQQEHVRRLSLVSDAIEAAVLITDADFCIVYVNAGFTRMFGWTQEEVVGQRPIALLAPHLPATLSDSYRTGLSVGQSLEREDLVVGKLGQRFWIQAVSTPIAGADGQWRYGITVLTDITQTKVYEALQQRVLEAMAREEPLDQVLNLVCREVEHIAPEVTASILAVDGLGLLHPMAAPSLPDSYSQLLEGLAIGPAVGSCGTAAWRNASVQVDDIANDPLWRDFKHLILPLGYQACWSSPIRNSQGQPIGTFAFYYRQPRSSASAAFHQRLVDVCTHLCALALERDLARERIQQLAFYDGLTGLPNRSLVQVQLEQALTAAARGSTQLAVLFIDLDRFKQINDSLGHAAGDELLVHVAQRLRQVLRNSDMAGRLSGDEFVIALPQCDAVHVSETIERLRAALAAPLTIANTALSLSVSIGVAMFPTDGRDMETLVHRADLAMYQAKRGGRAGGKGGYRFFSSEMNRRAQERLALEAALRQALQQGALRMHYQPQVHLSTGQLHGVEALARWRHPERGDIPPEHFIPLAEECGLIADLGLWALGEVCQQLSAWRMQGLVVPVVSVNLSAASFHNLQLPSLVTALLARHRLRPQDLVLELTESILLDTHPSTMQVIDAIHALGVHLSIDDFGTGYSSLSYLRHLPVSELKLDRSFVADLDCDTDAQALSNAILGIGKSLHLTVVAEGVETVSQFDLLQSQGYDVAQGFWFANPLPPQELADWVYTHSTHRKAPVAGYGVGQVLWSGRRQ